MAAVQCTAADVVQCTKADFSLGTLRIRRPRILGLLIGRAECTQPRYTVPHQPRYTVPQPKQMIPVTVLQFDVEHMLYMLHSDAV